MIHLIYPLIRLLLLHLPSHISLIRDRDCLKRVQRVSAKPVKGFSHLPYSTRLAELNIYPLESRHIRGDLMFLFHYLQTGDVHNFFTFMAQKHLRGQNKKLILPHCWTRIHHNFFTLRVISTWNALPEEIVSSLSKTTFKRLLDSYLGLHTWILLSLKEKQNKNQTKYKTKNCISNVFFWLLVNLLFFSC